MATKHSVFALSDLSQFERHGATIATKPGRTGYWIELPNGWTLSVQWGYGNYGSNRDIDYNRALSGEVLPDAQTAEIAAWRGDSGLVRWVDGDTVQGWCSVERVQHVLDLLADDALLIADDKWPEANDA
jgi:hypothetical protein